MSDPNATPTAPPNWRRRLRLSLIATLAILLVGAGVAAFTQGNAFGRMAGHGHSMWNDPARIDEGIERPVKHLAIEIDATPEQQEKLIVLAKAAAKDLLPLRQEMRTAGQDATALLTAATIDRAAIEQLRAARLLSIQQASTRVSEFLADAAEVLSIEQRKELADQVAEYRKHRNHR
jgi:protein CpxP